MFVYAWTQPDAGRASGPVLPGRDASGCDSGRLVFRVPCGAEGGANVDRRLCSSASSRFGSGCWLAQLGRAQGQEPWGRRFESCANLRTVNPLSCARGRRSSRLAGFRPESGPEATSETPCSGSMSPKTCSRYAVPDAPGKEARVSGASGSGGREDAFCERSAPCGRCGRLPGRLPRVLSMLSTSIHQGG